MDEKYIKLALIEANNAYKKGEVPVGAVIVKDGKVVSKAHNLKEKHNCITEHAELIAINKACKKLNNWRLDECVIYTTLFPCPMCASAIQQARMYKIVYINDSSNKYIFENSINILQDKKSNHRVIISKHDIEYDYLNKFFLKIRNK